MSPSIWPGLQETRFFGYRRLSLIVTTNLPFAQWTEVMGSERLTGALLDRLTHRVHIIEANGESYRFKHTCKRHRKATGVFDQVRNPVAGRGVKLATEFHWHALGLRPIGIREPGTSPGALGWG